MSRIIGTLTGGALGPLGTVANATANRFAPVTIPGPGELIDLLNSRRLTRRAVATLLGCHGIILDPLLYKTGLFSEASQNGMAKVWSRLAESRRPLPSIPELNVMANRGLIRQPDWTEAVLQQGWDGIWVDRFADLQKEIPGPSDLIRFVVKDVWNTEAIIRFQYDLEYPEAAEEWIAKQGLAYPIPSPIHDEAKLGPFSWAKAYWWSHWQLPSVGQGIQMLQRLRPSLLDPAVPRDPSGEVFTQADLDLLLKTQDYPKFWRRKLAALGYHPIGIRNLRALYKNAQVDEVGVAEIFMDQGYNRRDALIQARLIATEKEGEDLTVLKKQAEKQVLRGFQLGTVSHDNAVVQLYRLSLKRADQLAAFDAQAGDLQLAQANASPRVQLEISTNMVDERLDRIDRLTKLFHRSVVKGAMTGPQAQVQLQNLGIDPRRIQDLLAEWELERSVPERIETTSQIIRWVNEGLISPDEARLRLRDNHWAGPEIDLLLADAGLEQIGRRLRAVQAQSRGQLANQKIAARAARAAQQQLAAAARQLQKSASPSRLESLLSSGVIDPATYLRRVTALGISPEDAQLVVEYERRKRAAAEERAAARARARVSPNPVRPRTVPASTVLRWLKKGVVDEPDARFRLRALGYGPDDINDMLRAR